VVIANGWNRVKVFLNPISLGIFKNYIQSVNLV